MTSTPAQSTRREIRHILKLALPLIAGQFSIMGMGVVDVLVAGRAGTSDLAGVTVGFFLWDLTLFPVFGIVLANTALIGHRFGQGDRDGIRTQFQQCRWLCVPLSLCAGGLIWFGRESLMWFDLDEPVRAIARAYLLPSTLTTMLIPFGVCFRTTAEGIGLVRPVMLSSAFVFLVNIPLDYLLVLGGPGIEGMGGEGCGWASLIAFGLLLLIWIIYSLLSPTLTGYGLWQAFTPPLKSWINRTLSLGLPIGLSQLALGGFFAIIPLLMTPLGATALASHSVAMAVDMLMITIPIGLGQATSVRVSHALGSGSAAGARRSSEAGLLLVLALSFGQAAVLLALREPIAGLFSEDPAVVALGSKLLIFAAAYRIFDSLQLCAGMTLRGYKDTRVPSAINITAYWLMGLPLCWALGIGGYFDRLSGVYGFWSGMVLTIGLATVLMIRRLHLISRVERQPLAA